MDRPEIVEVVSVWKTYLETVTDWEILTAGITPKDTECGPVYEIPNPIPGREKESFAIAVIDKPTGPHYHTNGETEIYFGLDGEGDVYVGGEPFRITRGEVSVTPLDTVHFTVPLGRLVLAVVNTPPFDAANAISVSETDLTVGFDREQYDQVTQAA
jgi:mannose-6-phosphate isomerase-like protein (cupin superfamily)